MDVRSFAGVIFDCDGVLVDSEQPWIALMEHYLTAMGMHDAEGITAESLRGMTAAEAVTALARAQIELALDSTGSRSGPPTVAEVDAAYSEALEGLAAPMPGSVDVVRALSGGIPIGVASNGRRHDVRGLLKRVGLLNLFDTIVTIDDVDHGKPAPDAYLLAASRLGLDPHDVVVFEDSTPGASAGRAAGCTVIGVNAHAGAALPSHKNLRTLADLEYSLESKESGDDSAQLRVCGPWDS
ncbi:HAD family hydrolase [Brevibacterium yomogidense]|uniref:HAD family hydrolase n=1 Tax=Brevibacterium yomogidense TaxID=946573 RepID=UPI0018DF75A7|nr:HAD family phosphatase [Brevibacterium yomogidense]